MKVLVLSDSHGNLSNMMRAVEQESPRMILHLGDCWRDGERLHDRFPELPLGDKRVLMCHGHTYGVKQSLVAAGLAAEEKDLDLFLFGHTHKPLVDMRGKTLFLNPGSIGDYARPTYGIVTLENGRLDARTVLLKG